MKVVIQRVNKSSVTVKGKLVSSISKGLNLLVCIEKDDEKKNIEAAANKIIQLRIFESQENSRMDLSIKDVQGEILAISQFTLSWNGRKGNRPSFDKSKSPEEAKQLFNYFCEQLSHHVTTKKGAFGEYMNIQIENDGPVTFSLDF